MLCRRAFITLAVSGSLLVAAAGPAEAGADLVQKKSLSGPHGRSGKVLRYVDRQSGDTLHYLNIVADDADGVRGKCTETWIDYATKPHQHFNPGLLVNCSGESQRVSRVFRTRYSGIAGVQIVVCEVPDTSGRIVRNSANCRGISPGSTFGRVAGTRTFESTRSNDRTA